MLWFCDLLILNKDRVFIAVRRHAIFYARYVKVVPFVRGRCTKGGTISLKNGIEKGQGLDLGEIRSIYFGHILIYSTHSRL